MIISKITMQLWHDRRLYKSVTLTRLPFSALLLGRRSYGKCYINVKAQTMKGPIPGVGDLISAFKHDIRWVTRHTSTAFVWVSWLYSQLKLQGGTGAAPPGLGRSCSHGRTGKSQEQLLPPKCLHSFLPQRAPPWWIPDGSLSWVEFCVVPPPLHSTKFMCGSSNL